ncbi:MAG: Rid family detoxifying hydrolase [bacterium]
MNKKVISIDKTTDTPYSPAIAFGNLLFVSGQIASGKNSLEEEITTALNKLKSILQSAGSSLECVLKTTVFLKDMKNFNLMNEIYKTYFKAEPPARSCVEVSRLPFDVNFEIEAIAYIALINRNLT